MRGIPAPIRKAAINLLVVISLVPALAAPAAEPPQEGDLGEIVVRVVDESQAPQADAAISFFSFDRDWRTLKDLKRDAQTDKSGVAQYDRLATDETYVVRARAATIAWALSNASFPERVHARKSTSSSPVPCRP